jgi:hypothetical protein
LTQHGGCQKQARWLSLRERLLPRFPETLCGAFAGRCLWRHDVEQARDYIRSDLQLTMRLSTTRHRQGATIRSFDARAWIEVHGTALTLYAAETRTRLCMSQWTERLTATRELGANELKREARVQISNSGRATVGLLHSDQDLRKAPDCGQCGCSRHQLISVRL